MTLIFRAEKRGKRRRKDIDLINDNDDAIAKMIADMRLAAREDRLVKSENKFQEGYKIDFAFFCRNYKKMKITISIPYFPES